MSEVPLHIPNTDHSPHASEHAHMCGVVERVQAAALEATQGQMDGFFSQLHYECHLEEVAFVGD